MRYSFEDLEVWQRAVQFATDVIRLVEKSFPEKGHYRLIEQLESAATSIAMNIAEGKGRFSQKEFIQFLYISRGSLYETVTLLEIMGRLGWIGKEACAKLRSESHEISKMINGLISSLKKAHGS